MKFDIRIGYVCIRQDKAQINRTVNNTINNIVIFVTMKFNIRILEQRFSGKQRKKIGDGGGKTNILAKTDGEMILVIGMLVKQLIYFFVDIGKFKIEYESPLCWEDSLFLSDKQGFPDDLFQQRNILADGGLCGVRKPGSL